MVYFCALHQHMREFFGVQLVHILAVAEGRLPALWKSQCWAWLGCYKVALAPLKGRPLPAQPSVIRALAACGQRPEATNLARSIGSSQLRRSAASAVAAFDPALAAELLEGSPPTPLQAAVLSASGRKSAAQDVISRLEGRLVKNPNLALLQANCGELEPLAAFNETLSFFGLLPANSDGPPFPQSLCSSQIAPRAYGPLVSIIVPAHNTESLVAQAIGSLLDQTWSNIEIIAVDDASTDGTLQTLQRLAAQDSRVRVLSHPRNAGPYAARMTALSVARGALVTCHDSDDWAHPQRIERQAIPLMRNRRLMATVSDWVRMAEDGTFYVRKSWPLIHHNPASVMFRRQPVLDRMGGFDLVRAGADSEFYERLKVVFGPTAVLRAKGILAVGAHRPGSLMNDPKIGVTNHVLSPSRLAYWEAWRHWHVESLRAGRKPFMPPDGKRPFEAPSELLLQ
jgi:hypothetical protein